MRLYRGGILRDTFFRLKFVKEPSMIVLIQSLESPRYVACAVVKDSVVFVQWTVPNEAAILVGSQTLEQSVKPLSSWTMSHTIATLGVFKK